MVWPSLTWLASIASRWKSHLAVALVALCVGFCSGWALRPVPAPRITRVIVPQLPDQHEEYHEDKKSIDRDVRDLPDDRVESEFRRLFNSLLGPFRLLEFGADRSRPRGGSSAKGSAGPEE